MTTETGSKLAAALVKAQAGFGTVTKDKEVKVETKSGTSYKFKYAPLDTILDAVRKPLADNGLVVVQMLDDGGLTTMLLHESGERLGGTVALPASEDIKGYGSAITYMRRYAIQALLGIAAEDDDDGNRASGDQITEMRAKGVETEELLGKVDVKGKAVAGTSDQYKGEWKQGPDGMVVGFRLARNGDKDIPQVLVMGDIGVGLFAADPDASFIGQDVHVKGRMYAVKSPGRTTYNRLIVGEGTDSFIETDEWRIPAEPVAEGQVSAFDADLDAVVDKMPEPVA